MSFEERNTVIYIVVSLIIAAVFGSQIWTGTTDGSFAGMEGLVSWARTVLWMVPLGVVITIAAVILGQIIYGITTGDGDMDTASDERDHEVSARAARVTMVIFSLGWLAAIVLIASAYPIIAALNLMLFAGWLSDLIGNLVKLRIYRNGGIL